MPFTLAWSEIRFARLRFALIVLVVALLSALVFVMGAIGVGLGHANVSAVRALPGDGLAVQAEIDHSLPRSARHARAGRRDRRRSRRRVGRAARAPAR